MSFEDMRNALHSYMGKEIQGVVNVIATDCPDVMKLAIQFTGDNMPDVVRIIDYASDLKINGISYWQEFDEFAMYFEDNPKTLRGDLPQYDWFIWGDADIENKLKGDLFYWSISKSHHFDKHWQQVNVITEVK